jgi:beta-1,4-mannosyl-glycoprotein beta-1,4-N-acetylglucosaminyltransferase
MIVDCFTFYNEIDVLKKRLRYLSPAIDRFVLVESTVTHRGDPKELYFENNKEQFSEWLDKITHIIVDDNPVDEDPWSRENHQRNCILRGIEDLDDDDLVLISDVDEIPNKHMLELPASVKGCSYHMIAFQYNFKFMQTMEPWYGTVLSRAKSVRTMTPQRLREMRWSLPHYSVSGWHLSSFGDAEFAANKNHHFAHCRDVIASSMTLEDFRRFVDDGIHSDGKHELTRTPESVMSSLPDEIKCDYSR